VYLLWLCDKYQMATSTPQKASSPCNLSGCLKVFKNPTLLVEHLDRAHGKEKSILCELCDFRCHSMANLEKHKRRVHDKERNYPCEYCDKSFLREPCLQGLALAYSSQYLKVLDLWGLLESSPLHSMYFWTYFFFLYPFYRSNTV